ncbi:MAG TPA: polymer-forming cytoskeletal protein, partial [Sandaracinaceae bacterium]
REAVRDASVALRRAMPELDDLDAMIARAMRAAPSDAPTRRSLAIGGAVGGLAAAALAILSLPAASSMSGLGAAGRQAFTLARALDSLVESLVPGGWSAIALAGLGLAALLAWPLRWLLVDRRPGTGLSTGAIALALAVGVSAPALRAHAYRVEGEWPAGAPRVTVDVDGRPTSEALRLATEAAGLGLVARLPDDPAVTLHVREAPIDEVVQALLGDLDVVVIPGASLITVRPDAAPPPADPAEPGAGHDGVALRCCPPEVVDVPAAPDPAPAAPSFAVAAPSAPPAAPSPPDGVGDRVTFGADAVIGPDEVVRSVITMGGDARVLGRAYGDVVTMGGDAEIVGEVIGNVTTMGGDITVRAGARVHGDLNAMGGQVEVEDEATLHGQVLGAPGRGPHLASVHVPGVHDGEPDVYRWALWHALLFLFGLVMLGIARERFTVLRGELAARPVRSAFGGLFGLLAGGLLTIVLVLTLIGIPGAAVLGAVLFVAVCLGWAASAYWLGSVLPLGVLKDRPVLQLAVGVGALFVVGLVPAVGKLIAAAAALAGLGAVIATRFGKQARAAKRRHTPTGPFRGMR